MGMANVPLPGQCGRGQQFIGTRMGGRKSDVPGLSKLDRGKCVYQTKAVVVAEMRATPVPIMAAVEGPGIGFIASHRAADRRTSMSRTDRQNILDVTPTKIGIGLQHIGFD